MDPIKSAFWRSAAMEASLETSAMTLFPKAYGKFVISIAAIVLVWEIGCLRGVAVKRCSRSKSYDS